MWKTDTYIKFCFGVGMERRRRGTDDGKIQCMREIRGKRNLTRPPQQVLWHCRERKGADRGQDEKSQRKRERLRGQQNWTNWRTHLYSLSKTTLHYAQGECKEKRNHCPQQLQQVRFYHRQEMTRFLGGNKISKDSSSHVWKSSFLFEFSSQCQFFFFKYWLSSTTSIISEIHFWCPFFFFSLQGNGQIYAWGNHTYSRQVVDRD